MARKGHPEIRPLGVLPIQGDECWYYYYELPEGVLELEVFWDPTSERFMRKVSTFVTNEDHVRELLAS